MVLVWSWEPDIKKVHNFNQNGVYLYYFMMWRQAMCVCVSHIIYLFKHVNLIINFKKLSISINDHHYLNEYILKTFTLVY